MIRRWVGVGFLALGLALVLLSVCMLSYVLIYGL